MNFKMIGLVAAPFTPFEANGDLALGTIPLQARLLAANDVVGAFVCGTTGEGASLTTGERKAVTEAWVKARTPRLKVITHIGHLSQRESCELAAHAQAAGADAVATVAPSFFKPANAEQLVRWCEPIAAAAPKLPFYYYHIPSMTNVKIQAADFLANARGRIPTLVGVKFTHDDLVDYKACREMDRGGHDMLFGRDEILLSGLELGAKGAVGSTYNYSAPVYHNVMRAFAAKDVTTARREQKRAQDFIDVLIRYGGLPSGKAMMKMIGVDCGPVRSPLRSLDAAQEAAMRAELEALNFFSYTCTLPA